MTATLHVTSRLPRRGSRAAVAAVVGLAALALSLLPLTPAVAAGPADDLEHTLAERVGDVVGTAATGAAVVVTQGDRQLLAITDGYSDAKLTEPFTLQTRTSVASVSKMVTALSAITLDAEGVIDLSADLRRTSGA